MSDVARCHSFDVFDTCLVRVFGRPQDLFYALGHRLLDRPGSPAGDDEVHEFVRARVAAERRARQACPAEDLSLAAIYAQYPPNNPLGLAPQALLEAELALERESLRPVPAMLRRINALRGQGAAIAFISDMFLPQAFVRQVLQDHGFLRPGDGLYVSGDRGLTKHTGNLFRQVLADLGLAPGDLLHTGDNPHSDVAVPGRLGIRAQRFAAATLTPLEQGMLGRDGRTCLARSALAGAGRLARLAWTDTAGTDTARADDIRDGRLAAVAANVAAPMLVGFVAWVLDRARAQGIERLWFVARDGQIMHRVALELLKHTPGPECRYLYGSRQAWFLPSLETFNPRQVDWLVISGHCSRPASIVGKLECSPEEIEQAAGLVLGPAFWSTPLPRGGQGALLDLLDRPAVRALVEAKAQAARARLLAYLRQEGVADKAPVTLVDVGWTLKAQQALARVLRAAGLDCPVSGFYLGVSQSGLPASEAGPYQAYFLERDNWFDPAQPMNFLFRNANLVEQVFTAATHGQTVGYGPDESDTAGTMRPVLRPDPRSQGTLDAVRGMQECILEFARCAAQAGATRHPEILFRVALEALRSFLTRPGPELAGAVRDLPVYDDQNETRRRALARPVSLRTLAHLLAAQTRLARLLPGPRFEQSFDWIEGSVDLSPRWMRPLLRSQRLFLRLKEYRKSL